MKKVKLVITLEPDEIATAKKYAKAKGISVSKLIEDHFNDLKSDSNHKILSKEI